jgi:hypothetical protein
MSDVQPRPAVVHEFKILPEYFKLVADGIKTFELRKVDPERPLIFPGDRVVLREHLLLGGYTGRVLAAKVGYVFQGGNYGVEEGWVAFSLLGVEGGEHASRLAEECGQP